MSDSAEKRPELLNLLSVGPVGVTSPVEVERARGKMLPWLEEQVAAVPKQRTAKLQREQLVRALGWTGGGLAVAAAVILAFFFGMPGASLSGVRTAQEESPPARETATLVTGKLLSSSHTWMGGEQFELLGRLESGPEGAALQADRGYQLELRPSSAISFERPNASNEESTGIRLHHGEAKISVLPLPEGAKLIVKTGDVLLTVVKGAFTVEARNRSAGCIRVSQGEVVVRRGVESQVVSVGETFGCSEQKASGVAASPPVEKKKSAIAPRTTLSQENALLARALAAESRGKISEAKSAYQDLLDKYPRSAFAQDARAGLERLSY